MFGNILGIVLGLAAIGLGLKGFSPGGLPLGRDRAIREGAGKVIGFVFILMGLGFIVISAWSAARQGR